MFTHPYQNNYNFKLHSGASQTVKMTLDFTLVWQMDQQMNSREESIYSEIELLKMFYKLVFIYLPQLYLLCLVPNLMSQ